MHTIRNYIMAESLEQAWELNQKGRNNVIIGGNLWLKMGNRNILNAIDLSTLGFRSYRGRRGWISNRMYGNIT